VGNHRKQRIKSLCGNNILTGEYALYDNGRKGGWHYQDEDGTWHHTYGKTPTRALHNAYIAKKGAIIARAKEVFKGRLK
jgi:hypothetical protein